MTWISLDIGSIPLRGIEKAFGQLPSMEIGDLHLNSPTEMSMCSITRITTDEDA